MTAAREAAQAAIASGAAISGMLGSGRLPSYYSGMENPQQPPEPRPTLAARLTNVLTEFVEKQKPTTQAAIARVVGQVNDLLSRLQKKK